MKDLFGQALLDYQNGNYTEGDFPEGNYTEGEFPEGEFNSVLVQGDTASAFACAIAAFNRKKKIYYLEAGLRSYNLDHPYPEEGYRQMVARLADVNLCPT